MLKDTLDKYLFLIEGGSCWFHFCAPVGSAGLLYMSEGRFGSLPPLGCTGPKEVKATRENDVFQSPLCHRLSECTCTCLINSSPCFSATVA